MNINTIDQLQELGLFPNKVYTIHLGDGLFAANNATAPDLTVLNGLACFSSEGDADDYMLLEPKKCLRGEIHATTFNDARDLAKAKLQLNSLLLFRGGRIIDFHFIR